MGLFKTKPKHEIPANLARVTYDDPISGLNRQVIIKTFVTPGTSLELVPEPDNPVDPEAVAVYLRRRILLVGSKDYHLGYLKHRLAHDMLRHLSQGAEPTVTVMQVTGGTKAKPTFGVNVMIRF